MPNWCNTTYKFVGKAEEIADLHQKLRELEQMPKPIVETDFGNLWLGCVVNYFGGDYHNIYCRGMIDYLELCGDSMIQLSTMTAWGDMPEIWDFVLTQYPSVEYYFLAEEPGMCYFVNSDVDGEYFPEKYVIYQMDGMTDYLNEDEELLEYIAERIGMEKIETIEQMNELLDTYNKTHPDHEIYYYEFKHPES